MNDDGVAFLCTAFNEGVHIKNTLNELYAELQNIGYAYHVFVIDDGSTDNTYDGILKVSENKDDVTVIKNEVNYGFGYSIRKGLELAWQSHIVWFPTHGMIDVQSLIHNMQRRDENSIIIFDFKNKFIRPLLRVVLSYLYVFIMNIFFGLELPSYNTCVLFPKCKIKVDDLRSDRSFILVELIVLAVKAWGLTPKIENIYLRPRRDGKSKSFNIFNVMEIVENMFDLKNRLRQSRKNA